MEALGDIKHESSLINWVIIERTYQGRRASCCNINLSTFREWPKNLRLIPFPGK